MSLSAKTAELAAEITALIDRYTIDELRTAERELGAAAHTDDIGWLECIAAEHLANIPGYLRNLAKAIAEVPTPELAAELAAATE